MADRGYVACDRGQIRSALRIELEIKRDLLLPYLHADEILSDLVGNVKLLRCLLDSSVQAADKLANGQGQLSNLSGLPSR